MAEQATRKVLFYCPICTDGKVVNRTNVGGICTKCRTPFNYNPADRKYLFSKLNQKYLNESLIAHAKDLFREYRQSGGLTANGWHSLAKRSPTPTPDYSEPNIPNVNAPLNALTETKDTENGSSNPTKQRRKGLIAAIISVAVIGTLSVGGFLFMQAADEQMLDIMNVMVEEKIEELDLSEEISYGSLSANTFAGTFSIAEVKWESEYDDMAIDIGEATIKVPQLELVKYAKSPESATFSKVEVNLTNISIADLGIDEPSIPFAAEAVNIVLEGDVDLGMEEMTIGQIADALDSVIISARNLSYNLTDDAFQYADFTVNPGIENISYLQDFRLSLDNKRSEDLLEIADFHIQSKLLDFRAIGVVGYILNPDEEPNWSTIKFDTNMALDASEYTVTIPDAGMFSLPIISFKANIGADQDIESGEVTPSSIGGRLSINDLKFTPNQEIIEQITDQYGDLPDWLNDDEDIQLHELVIDVQGKTGSVEVKELVLNTDLLSFSGTGHYQYESDSGTSVDVGGAIRVTSMPTELREIFSVPLMFMELPEIPYEGEFDVIFAFNDNEDFSVAFEQTE